ncbi:hypothetical protein DRN50_04635 [Thermococci archaeon]|nr:MAG: hypothetical protein DRN50_04635 [Thermococci archaeon]
MGDLRIIPEYGVIAKMMDDINAELEGLKEEFRIFGFPRAENMIKRIKGEFDALVREVDKTLYEIETEGTDRKTTEKEYEFLEKLDSLKESLEEQSNEEIMKKLDEILKFVKNNNETLVYILEKMEGE